MKFNILNVYDSQTKLIVPCAIIFDREDCYDVKPLNIVHFTRCVNTYGSATNFITAWWRVAKNDLSAELSTDTFDSDELHPHVFNHLVDEFYSNPLYAKFIPEAYRKQLPEIFEK